MRAPSRRGALAVAAGLAVLAPRLAAAQAGPGPSLPVALDLRKVPVGAWSEYTVTVAQMPPFKQRFALVARDAHTCTVEMTAEGGMIARGGKLVLKVVLDPDLSRPDRVKNVVMQLGGNDPMEVQTGMGISPDHFGQLDPKKLAGRAAVKVPAGRFDTRRYTDKKTSGETVDVWVSDGAPPFGIVKMSGSLAQGPGAPTFPLKMELARRGTGAKAAVTKPARPFDPQILMGEMNRTLGGGPPPAAGQR